MRLYEIKSPDAAWWVAANTAFSALLRLKDVLDAEIRDATTDRTVLPEELRVRQLGEAAARKLGFWEGDVRVRSVWEEFQRSKKAGVVSSTEWMP